MTHGNGKRWLLNILVVPLALCVAVGIALLSAGAITWNQSMVTYGTIALAAAAWCNAARGWIRQRDTAPALMAIFCSSVVLFRFVCGLF